MSAPIRVLVVGEGRSEIGRLDAIETLRGKKTPRTTEGYMPPIVRKLLESRLPIEVIDGQRVTLLGKFGSRIPGHGDRAAKALSIAAINNYDLLVFVKDVDRVPGKKKSERERLRKLKEMHHEIQSGFERVEHAEHVHCVKATPCRMIEAWALGDPNAINRVAYKRAKRAPIPEHPEKLWGAEENPTSNHPKCVLARALGREVNAEVLEDIALESNVETLKTSCPDSFAPFAKEMDEVP